MGTLDQADRAPLRHRPGLAWRLLSPVGAVVLAFVLLVAGAVALDGAGLSEDATAAVLAFFTSLLLLLFGVALWRGLPEHDRRWAVADKRSRRAAVGAGLGIGIGIVFGAAVIILVGSLLDPAVEERLEQVEEIGTEPWQLVLTITALVVLAPLGEELLFRGLLLRALVRRIRFWPAAVVSAALFAAAHADAYVIWPRAVALVVTGVVLAWLYRRRGYWASVTAHATVNGVASVALVAASSS